MDMTALYELYLRHRVVCTDTRQITPGCLFVALKGETFDGNAFARKALAEGAAAAVVSDERLEGPAFFHVPDTLVALQQLARHHRRQLDIPVLAITGSNGKTTTKELIHAVLSTTFRVHATRGNLNNHIGVPLTLLGIPADTELLVCEMGANHVGEIALLAGIAEPTHGLITNIGRAHLEGFGSLEGVKRGKGELFDFLRHHNGFAFVNGNDPALIDLASALQRKITYGLTPIQGADVSFHLDESTDHEGFILHDAAGDTVIKASLYGAYNAINMVAAVAVGRHFGVPEPKLVQALSTFTSGANRSEVIQHRGCVIIKDAYNANPTSMEASVRAFATKHSGGWVIVGDMKELGAESRAAHRQLLDLMISLPIGRIFVVGEEFTGASRDIRQQTDRMTTAKDIQALRARWTWPEGIPILIKGSRSMQLEKILED